MRALASRLERFTKKYMDLRFNRMQRQKMSISDRDPHWLMNKVHRLKSKNISLDRKRLKDQQNHMQKKNQDSA